jgi:hypothetical protein
MAMPSYKTLAPGALAPYSTPPPPRAPLHPHQAEEEKEREGEGRRGAKAIGVPPVAIGAKGDIVHLHRRHVSALL